MMSLERLRSSSCVRSRCVAGGLCCDCVCVVVQSVDCLSCVAMQIMSASPTPSESPTPSTTPSVTLTATGSGSRKVSVTGTPTVSVTATVSASVSPTASPSTLCAAGWSYYSDSDGSEGQASCLKVTGSNTYPWGTAMLSCPMNSHLLTIAGASMSTGLFAFSRNVSASNFWVGASQSSLSIAMNRGWAWIDGTSATVNLNCDAAASGPCGLWREFAPGYDDIPPHQLFR